ncbi:MAG: hypothetical protein HY046_03640 [Acidobacteria bacterium]|nr:hypothetical protein [Acidobacteriota bacterium]
MKKAAVLIYLLLAVAAAGQKPTVTPVLEGLDPVLLLQGKEVQGTDKISVTRGNFQYLFSSDANKVAFEKEPERFAIQLKGACALFGAPVAGNPDLWVVHEGKIYIFASEQCVKNFKASPEKFLESSVPAWTSTRSAEKNARSLLEKTVKAMGGSARLNSIHGFQEKLTASDTRRDGTPQSFESTDTYVFPGRMKSESKAPWGEFRQVLTPKEAFMITSRGVRELDEMGRDSMESGRKRHPLVLLRARRDPQFRATALGRARVGETEVERVLIDFSGDRMTLGIEPATNEIRSLSYPGRAPSGEVGEIVREYSDFRDVNGLRLPFKVKCSFKGTLLGRFSPTTESIALNPAVDAATFEKPKDVEKPKERVQQ